MNDQRGTCLTDNQGNPIPQIGGQCDLALMHLNASAITIPDSEAVYGMGMASSQGLDWEFYQINPRASSGAQPASQNDFYGNMYSLGAYASEQPQFGPVVVPAPCNCPPAQAKSNGMPAAPKQAFVLLPGLSEATSFAILFFGFFLLLYLRND
jgi:hypothetical protein